MAIIRISDLHLRTVIGTNSWERDIKQDLIINIAIDFDSTPAAKTDKIKDTLDYKKVTKKIIHYVEHSKFFLLETLTEKILDLIMQDKKVFLATVRIDKPQALRFAKSVSIESHRNRML